MTRSWVERALAALMAVWFVLVTIEPAALHSCPMHGGHATAHAVAASHHAGHAATPEAPPPEAAQHCTCLGDCAGVAPAALPARVTTPWPAALAAVSSLPPLEAGFTPPAAPFALPFGNGPPAIQG